MAGQGPIPRGKPKRRVLNVRSLSIALEGKEQPYPVYRFSGKVLLEKPEHNPFKGL